MPEHFPGTVGLVENPECDNKIIINPNYRQYTVAEEDEDFYNFVTRILAAINSASSDFRQRKEKQLISDILSVTDAAFGLILLYNKHHVWVHQRRTKSYNPLLQRRK